MEERTGKENFKEPRELAELKEQRLWVGERGDLMKLEVLGQSSVKEEDIYRKSSKRLIVCFI